MRIEKRFIPPSYNPHSAIRNLKSALRSRSLHNMWHYSHERDETLRTRVTLVGLLCLCLLALNGCEHAASTPQAGANNSRTKSNAYEPPVRLAELEDDAITESSGIVASRRNPDIFWTHNDSGDGPILYAFDRKGKNMGRWRVAGAQAVDWEDIAAGPGPQPGVSYLYIGDIGDNVSRRESITVYRVAEPSITSHGDSSSRAVQQVTEEAEAIRLKYPDGKHDAETLMVHPTTGDIYIITKSLRITSGVYKLKAPYSASVVNTLERLGEISVPNLAAGLITGGDISPDGRRVVLCDYLAAYEVSLPANLADNFDQIWKQPMETIELGQRRQGESVCYRLDGQAILATSEKQPTPLIEVKRKKK